MGAGTPEGADTDAGAEDAEYLTGMDAGSVAGAAEEAAGTEAVGGAGKSLEDGLGGSAGNESRVGGAGTARGDGIDGRGGGGAGGRDDGGGAGSRGGGRGGSRRSAAVARAAAHASEGDLGDGGALGGAVELPVHGDVGPADAAVGHGDHVTGDVGVVGADDLADLLAVAADHLELGAGEGAAAAHGVEVADGVGDLLPGDEGLGAVESGGVGVGAVVGAGRDPVDLAVAAGGTDLGRGLLADDGLLVREEGDGDVAVAGAVDGFGVALAHPVVEGQVLGAAGDPGEDVRVGADEAGQDTVGAGRAAHGLVGAAVDDVLVGDLDAVAGHALGFRVQPDGTLVLGAEGGEGRGVGGLEGDAGVVGAAPGGGGAGDVGEFTGGVDVADGVAKVARGVALVGGHDDVGGVVAGLLGEDEVAVDVGGSHGLVAVDVGAAEPGLEGLLAGGVAVEDGDGRVGGAAGEQLVGQDGETVVVGDEAAGLLTARDGDGLADGGEGGGVDLLDVDARLGGVEVREPGRLAVGGDGERGAAVVGVAGPVGLLDRVEGLAEGGRVDVLLERGRGQLGDGRGREAKDGEETHRCFWDGRFWAVAKDGRGLSKSSREWKTGQVW
ncbi:LOW QUALITY PROTEIN: PE-PGRS family protein [Colletotrichum tofieldiae]|nr:LOW QUALITY PROTEIN: PE-PGRS family protein [Colletotrichum tofieldiae]GKT78342.1 LOW QUALITY PROTEIN: PE-PGRS family protein [Colletotrichum tofieldiae]